MSPPLIRDWSAMVTLFLNGDVARHARHVAGDDVFTACPAHRIPARLVSIADRPQDVQNLAEALDNATRLADLVP